MHNILKTTLILLFLLLLLGSQYSTARNRIERQQEIEDSLLSALNDVSLWAEKRSIYESLIDLSYNDRKKRLRYCVDLHCMSHKAQDYECEELMLRELGNLNSLDSLKRYIHCAEQLQKHHGRDVRATLCFLHIRETRVTYRVKSMEECLERLHEILNEYKAFHSDEKNNSVYDQIGILSDIAFFLNLSEAEGDFYLSSMNKLQQLSESLPVTERFLTASVYIRLSSLYSNMDEHHLSLQVDSLFLNYLHDMENYYKKQHRPYRSYEMYYYQLYYRMLSNYEVLNEQQINGLYNKALTCESYASNVIQPDILRFYYNMGTRNYGKAFGYLNKLLDSSGIKNAFSTVPAYKCINYKIFLSKKLGLDKDSLVAYYSSYVEELNKYNTTRETARLAETHILYNVDSLRTQNNQLKLEKQESELASKQQIIIIGIFMVFLLAVACILFAYLYINKRIYNKRLQKERNDLILTQKQLIIAKEKAERSEQLKSSFLANMSHEIRTPLNAIVGFSGLIFSTDDKTEQEEFFNIIQTNSDLLLTLVNDILELSKLEAGYTEFKMQEFDMTELLHQTAMIVRQRITSHDVELLEEYPPYQQCIIETDKKAVMQLFINFGTNAIKYTEKGTITLAYAIQEHGLYLSVKDTGRGIPEENQQQVFERFEKLGSFVQGIGLGLSICKAITDNLEGRIGVKSKEGEGSTFWAWIPIRIKETIV